MSSGLENIINKICEQNEIECKNTIDRAKAQAQEILGDAKIKAQKMLDSNSEKIKEKIENEKVKGASRADLEYKRVILSHKSKILDDMIQDALSQMCSADDETYFSYVEKLVLSNALSGEGKISFGKRDYARLPENFVEKLNKSLAEGKTVSLSSECIDTEGGFVINYPKMRVDCTFASLVADNADNIKDKMNNILFS